MIGLGLSIFETAVRRVPPAGAGAGPTLLSSPTIAGTAASGATLTTTDGTWSGSPTIARQWYADKVAIIGATAASYTMAAADGVFIRCKVTATNSNGSTVAWTAPAQYLGQLATKCWGAPNATSTSNKQFMSRSPHFARVAITSLAINLPNWYWDRASTKTEIGSGGTAAYTASVEYPAGTFTQIKFGGAVTSPAAASAVDTLSDQTAVSIPAGALFWIRVFCTAATGIVFDAGFTSGTSPAVPVSVCDLANGQALTYAASGLTDQTMGGTVANTATSAYPSFTPTAIVGLTTAPSVFLFGDSRVYGTGDSFDTSGDLGETARSIGPTLPYVNAGCHGDTAALAKTNYYYRSRAAQWCSHIVGELGINDITAGSATAWADVLTTLGLLRASGKGIGRPVYYTTITPVSTSTDSFATTANQTTNTYNANRAAFNDNIRTTPSPLIGYFENADQVETARNSGIVRANGSAYGYSADGTHLTRAGELLITAAGSVNVATIGAASA